jgi:hypothetical protein
MAEKAKVPTVTILGREVTFKQFNDTQLVLIHRMRQMLSGAMAKMPDLDAEDDDNRELTPQESQALASGMDVMAKFLDMLGFMVVGDDDREFLLMQMLAGNLGLSEIADFVQDLVPHERRAVEPKKRAARAR